MVILSAVVLLVNTTSGFANLWFCQLWSKEPFMVAINCERWWHSVCAISSGKWLMQFMTRFSAVLICLGRIVHCEWMQWFPLLSMFDWYCAMGSGAVASLLLYLCWLVTWSPRGVCFCSCASEDDFVVVCDCYWGIHKGGYSVHHTVVWLTVVSWLWGLGQCALCMPLQVSVVSPTMHCA